MSDAWFQDPKDEATIIRMVERIKGMNDPFVMKMKLVEGFGHRQAGGWMGEEAIKRELIRAKLFEKEKADA